VFDLRRVCEKEIDELGKVFDLGKVFQLRLMS
jgi:hypothetical protein